VLVAVLSVWYAIQDILLDFCLFILENARSNTLYKMITYFRIKPREFKCHSNHNTVNLNLAVSQVVSLIAKHKTQSCSTSHSFIRKKSQKVAEVGSALHG
jgi:hypothetical protein